MAGEHADLDSHAKVAKAIELAEQGYSRQEIALMLYKTTNTKTALKSVRDLLSRRGYVYSETSKRYIQKTAVEAEQRINKKQQQVEGEQQVEAVKKQTKTNNTALTVGEVEELRELLSLTSKIETLQALLEANLQQTVQKPVQAISKPLEVRQEHKEVPLEFRQYVGVLQGTTLQLHKEVWRRLDGFAKRHRVSKKAIVNDALMDWLDKWEAETDRQGSLFEAKEDTENG